MWKTAKWSPVEEAYLKDHAGDPVMQLCIALAKSKNAINKKLLELGCKKGKKQKAALPGNKSFRSRIGKRKDLGIFLRSSWEANFLRFLKYKSTELGIKLISYEPIDFTFWQFNIRRGQVSYTPDFKVEYLDGRYEYIEVKGGFLKSGDKTKLRRFKKFYPEEFKHLRCVPPSNKNKTTLFFNSLEIPVAYYYNELKKEWSKTIPEWEL